MNTVMLNTTSLDGGVIIKKGSGGGGGIAINNQDKVVDIVENGSTEVVADAGFTGLGKVSVNVNVPSSGGGDTPSRPTWTGHADAEGLRAIGWTDEDIAYYQEHGVNWNAEDDEYHKVTDDNKALYGVLTADNISSYRDRIVYLPKIDTSGKTSMYEMFAWCRFLVGIPMLDTSNVTNMTGTFNYCYRLTCIPPLITSNVTRMEQFVRYCVALQWMANLDISNVTNLSSMFSSCGLKKIPPLNTGKTTSVYQMFNSNSNVSYIELLDFAKVTSANNCFVGCNGITTVKIKNLAISLDLSYASALSKESLLYIINNEAATSAITIRLDYYAYEKLSNDADVVAALENHPNISILQ